MLFERSGERLGVVGDVAYMEDGDVTGGDDDRWGDADPWEGDPENPDPEEGTDGDDEEGNVGGSGPKTAPEIHFWLRLLHSMFVLVSVR